MGREIPVLQDMRMSLKDVKSIIDDLIECYGSETLLVADAGWNNVSFKIEFPDEKIE